MPSPNSLREYDSPAFYHIYNRGACDQDIFLDDNDKHKFLALIERHVCEKDESDAQEMKPYIYPTYDIEIVAYCLMSNHFHILTYQENDDRAITKLLRSVSTAYTMYFNRKYKKRGHLFQGVFKASRINTESYLLHISRYIHMNPRSYKTYKWSSLGSYIRNNHKPWLHPERIMTITADEYVNFLNDYELMKEQRKVLRKQLGI